MFNIDVTTMNGHKNITKKRTKVSLIKYNFSNVNFVILKGDTYYLYILVCFPGESIVYPPSPLN